MASRKRVEQIEPVDYMSELRSIENTLARMNYKVNQIDARLNKHYRLLKEILESYWQKG